MRRRESSREAETLERPAGRRGRTGRRVASKPEGTSLPSMLFHKEIAARAYEFFLARGGQHGNDWADWFQAEAEVLGKRNPGGGGAGN